MNNTVYIFGNLSAGYTQFPNDCQSSKFSSVNPVNVSGVFIRRDGNMSWCIYRRNLSNEYYIGFAVGFNGVCCTSSDSMFSIFESTVSVLALEGKLIGYSENGELCPLVSKLSISKSDVEKISARICAAFDELKSQCFCSLPPINYGSSSNNTIVFGEEVSGQEICQALNNTNFINIHKGNRIDAADSYASKLKAVNDKVVSLVEQNSALHENLKKMERQKKRTTLVTVLVIAIAIIFSVFMSVNVNLNDKLTSLRADNRSLKEMIEENQTIIQDQATDISIKDAVIKDLGDSLSNTISQLNSQKSANRILQQQNSQLDSKLYSLRNDISNKTKEITTLKSQLSSEKSDKSSWISAYNSKNKQVQELSKRVNELTNQVSNLQKQLLTGRRRR